MKKIITILALLFSFSFTSNSYAKTEIHWWYGNSGFLGDVIIEIQIDLMLLKMNIQ